MQLDLLGGRICPFIHPVELSTRARQCRPRQGWIPGRVGYQDTRILYPACWCFQNSCGCTSFSLLYSLLCYFFFWQQFFFHRAGGFWRISMKSRVAPTRRFGRVFPFGYWCYVSYWGRPILFIGGLGRRSFPIYTWFLVQQRCKSCWELLAESTCSTSLYMSYWISVESP